MATACANELPRPPPGHRAPGAGSILSRPRETTAAPLGPHGGRGARGAHLKGPSWSPAPPGWDPRDRPRLQRGSGTLSGALAAPGARGSPSSLRSLTRSSDSGPVSDADSGPSRGVRAHCAPDCSFDPGPVLSRVQRPRPLRARARTPVPGHRLPDTAPAPASPHGRPRPLFKAPRTSNAPTRPPQVRPPLPPRASAPLLRSQGAEDTAPNSPGPSSSGSSALRPLSQSAGTPAPRAPAPAPA